MVVQHMPRNVPPIERLPHLISRLRVTILNKGLETSSLLKSGKLVHKAEGAEDQVQYLNSDLDGGLQPAGTVSTVATVEAAQLVHTGLWQ